MAPPARDRLVDRVGRLAAAPSLQRERRQRPAGALPDEPAEAIDLVQQIGERHRRQIEPERLRACEPALIFTIPLSFREPMLVALPWKLASFAVTDRRRLAGATESVSRTVRRWCTLAGGGDEGDGAVQTALFDARNRLAGLDQGHALEACQRLARPQLGCCRRTYHGGHHLRVDAMEALMQGPAPLLQFRRGVSSALGLRRGIASTLSCLSWVPSPLAFNRRGRSAGARAVLLITG